MQELAKQFIYKMDNKLPSRFQINDLVCISFPNSGFIVNKAKVIKVHFTESKVLYDLEVYFQYEDDEKNNSYTRLYNVDSLIVSPFEESLWFRANVGGDTLNQLIKTMKVDTNKISDGYHTFEDLYEFRKVYNAALFNEWAMLWNENKQVITPKYNVHKSWKHHDGELCFGGGWFIVVAILPDGQISNHYEAKDWDLFKIPEVDKALYEFDGHTSTDVLNRLKNL